MPKIESQTYGPMSSTSRKWGATLSREAGHWLVDDLVANPMSIYPEYRDSRDSWGMGVLGSVLVEVETESGEVGVATGLGGDAACFLIERRFCHFVGAPSPTTQIAFGTRCIARVRSMAARFCLWPR